MKGQLRNTGAQRAATLPRPGSQRRSAVKRQVSVCGGPSDAQSIDNAGNASLKLGPEITRFPTRLNTYPLAREQRQFFYHDCAFAVLRCVNAGHTRIQMRLTIPETNPEMDVYRIGTVLEMVREQAVQLAQDGKRVKICVQGSMGQGVFQGLPLTLSGVAKIMEMMDWGEAAEYVTLGAVGAEDARCDADVFLLIAPQNVVGNTIMTNLLAMVEEAEKSDKTVVLINPTLADIPGHSGVMGIRGRSERLAFADSFTTAYHCRLLYYSGIFYPIVGALRYSYGSPKWQAYKRINVTRDKEEYQLWGEFDQEPNGGRITKCFEQKVQLLDRAKEAQEIKAKPQQQSPTGWRWW